MTEKTISNNITLYAFAASPDAAKVHCILDYKGLEFNTIYVDPLSRRQLGFTGQSGVPVLKIDDQWRAEPTAIGLWLEERFPQHPILGSTQAERARILALDQWVAGLPNTAFLRELVEWDSLFTGLYNGWRLAAVSHRARRLPLAIRLLWPLILKLQPPVRKKVAATNPDSLQKLRERVCRELIEHLEGGPFLGGFGEPSLADLAAYPLFVLPYVIGLKREPTFLRFPQVLGWMSRVQAHLPGNPLPVASDALKRPLPYSVPRR